MAEPIAAIYAVFGSDEEAQCIGRAMVEARLAACVNLLGPCHSIYRWQGAIEEAEEVAAIFKTAAAQVDALIAAIRAAHSYEVPAIVQLEVGAVSADYAAWIGEAIRRTNASDIIG